MKVIRHQLSLRENIWGFSKDGSVFSVGRYSENGEPAVLVTRLPEGYALVSSDSHKIDFFTAAGERVYAQLTRKNPFKSYNRVTVESNVRLKDHESLTLDEIKHYELHERVLEGVRA